MDMDTANTLYNRMSAPTVVQNRYEKQDVGTKLKEDGQEAIKSESVI